MVPGTIIHDVSVLVSLLSIIGGLLTGQQDTSLTGSTVKWGRVQANLQLGIERPQSPESGGEIHILLRNVGAEAREITAGFEGSVGPMYNVNLSAVSGAQPRREQTIFDVNALKAQPSSRSAPITARIEPAAVYVFEFPLNRLICVVDRKDVPVEDLLRRGYSIRASLAVSGMELRTPNLAIPR